MRIYEYAECADNRISIIIPVYNVEKYIRRCLDSVLNQTYSNYEVLIVDDGSTDSSADIAREYEVIDSRFNVLNKENGGQGSARNYALDNISGNYISFIDSDDWVHPEFLERLITSIKEEHADVAMCNVQRVWDKGAISKKVVGNCTSQVVEDIEEFLKTASFVVWNKLYKRELFQDIRFPEKMMYEDFACVPTVLIKAKRISIISDALYNYFWRPGSTTNSYQHSADILKAQNILETSSLADKTPKLLMVYFVREVLGSYVERAILDNSRIWEIDEIMRDGKRKYSNMTDYIKKPYVRNPFISRLIYKEKYNLVWLIMNIRERMKDVFRPIYHILLKYK